MAFSTLARWVCSGGTAALAWSRTLCASVTCWVRSASCLRAGSTWRFKSSRAAVASATVFWATARSASILAMPVLAADRSLSDCATCCFRVASRCVVASSSALVFSRSALVCATVCSRPLCWAVSCCRPSCVLLSCACASSRVLLAWAAAFWAAAMAPWAATRFSSISVSDPDAARSAFRSSEVRSFSWRSEAICSSACELSELALKKPYTARIQPSTAMPRIVRVTGRRSSVERSPSMKRLLKDQARIGRAGAPSCMPRAGREAAFVPRGPGGLLRPPVAAPGVRACRPRARPCR